MSQHSPSCPVALPICRSPYRLLVAALVLFAMSGMPCFGESKAILDAAVSETVRQFNILDPRHAALEDRAAGILIFPQVSKGGLALASGYGEGALEVNGTIVDYYSIASASVGLTAGIGAHSEVILFMNPDALARFKASKGWSVAADSGIAMMSKGMASDYESAALKKPVLVFVFGEKGLIADLSLRGSKIHKLSK